LWKKSPRFERFTRINPAIFKTLSCMKRQEASVMTQLRTNCVDLKKGLPEEDQKMLNEHMLEVSETRNGGTFPNVL
jgi:hypothetical protein